MEKYFISELDFFLLLENIQKLLKNRILDMIRDELGADYDVEQHFTPHINHGTKGYV